MGHGWGKLTQFLVEDEYLVLVIFSHPGSVHPVNHLRVGVAHLLRDEFRVSTGSYQPACLGVSGLVCSAIANPMTGLSTPQRNDARHGHHVLPSWG